MNEPWSHSVIIGIKYCTYALTRNHWVEETLMEQSWLVPRRFRDPHSGWALCSDPQASGLSLSRMLYPEFYPESYSASPSDPLYVFWNAQIASPCSHSTQWDPPLSLTLGANWKTRIHECSHLARLAARCLMVDFRSQPYLLPWLAQQEGVNLGRRRVESWRLAKRYKGEMKHCGGKLLPFSAVGSEWVCLLEFVVYGSQ